MIITIIFVFIIAFGIYRKVTEDKGFGAFLIGGIGLVLCLAIIFFNNYIGGNSNVINYYQDKVQIELAINNKNITEIERQAAIELAIQDNIIISTAKRWYKDPFIGWFGQTPIVNLELFDISKIPSADMNITIKK